MFYPITTFILKVTGTLKRKESGDSVGVVV
jgi:hypothetical protein